MSAEDQKLIDDHKSVLKTIKLYSNINLINTKGDPANEYDIEYKVKGYTRGLDGSIKVGNSHRVKITLPFGYPHFPPTIKPLSNIHHPQVDDNVIPIANHWEKNKNLADLVIHIGKMICAEEYTLSSPFNAEAAEYYEKHFDKLPLDGLRLVKDEKKREKKDPIQLSFLAPLLRITAMVVVFLSLAATGLFVYEKIRLNKSEEAFETAKNYLANNNFKKAETSAKNILTDINYSFFFKGRNQSLQEELNNFLQSEPLMEGLKGRIKFGDSYVDKEYVRKIEVFKQFFERGKTHEAKGDISLAIQTYEKAIDFKEKNGLDFELRELSLSLAKLQLQLLVEESEKTHESKNWDWAIENHKKVIRYIEENEQSLPDGKAQLEKTQHLLLIDSVALYSETASDAEDRGDLEAALKSYQALISTINNSPKKSNPTLHATLLDAIQKSAQVSEKFTILQKRKWLVSNYREIFQLHYPTILAQALSSPQAIFVKYDEHTMVFDLSCLEKGTGSVVRLRIYYQYDPITEEWSHYDKEIEEDS